MQWVEDRLRELADKDGQYREFNARVVATADPATMLGVRVPKLRRLAREVSRSGDRDAFLGELPHRWYEEYLVHAFALNETREVEPVLEEELPAVLMDYGLVLDKASENASFPLDNAINLLRAPSIPTPGALASRCSCGTFLVRDMTPRSCAWRLRPTTASTTCA